MRFREFNLSEAVSDPEVVKTQEKLKKLGYDLGAYGPKGDGIDGIIGPYTRAAMDAYAKGIKPNETPAPNRAAVAKFDIDNKPTDKTSKSSETTASGDIIPTKGPVTGEYGQSRIGPNGNRVQHPGVDIAAPEGTPIVAPADGVVKYAGWGNSAGNLVELITSDNAKHRFMHLSKILVQTGDRVRKGQIVGNVGNTGFSRGAHLHWEKYVDGTTQVNPLA